MDTNANVQVIQQVYADFLQQNLMGILSVMSDDIEWSDPGAPDLPYARLRHGKDEVTGFFMEFMQLVEFSKFEPKEYVAQGDKVVALGSFAGTARATGKSFESDWAMVWTFKEGKIVRYQTYEDTNALVKAIQ